MIRGGRIAKQNASKLYLICDSERSEIPKDFFGKLREDPLRSRGKETGRAGETPPPCLPHGKKTAGRTAGKRRAVPISARPCLVACAGTPHSDALHPIYVFRNAFLTCFFKKFQKTFRQMRDKYHYKAYVAFRMRENCTECRSNNSGSPIQYPIWPRPVSGRSYPRLPQKAASVWMHALSLS